MADIERRSPAGFSLLEMLVVLLILASVVMLAPPLAGNAGTARLLDATTRDVADVLRATRMAAISANAERSVVLDRARRTVVASGVARQRELPAGFEIHAQAPVTDGIGGGNLRIRFFPDGSASGGVIRLRAGYRTATIAVDWLTGRVRTSFAGGG